MKIGDLIVTNDGKKIGIILEGARDWFHRKGEKYIDEEPNLFYVYWVDVESGEKKTTWHKETEDIVTESKIYEG